MTSAIDKAIEAAGSQQKLGDRLMITQQAVAKMRRRGFAAPARARQLADMFPEIGAWKAFADPALVED